MDELHDIMSMAEFIQWLKGVGGLINAGACAGVNPDFVYRLSTNEVHAIPSLNLNLHLNV